MAWLRNSVFYAKSKFKGSSFSISEMLLPKKLKILQSLRKTYPKDAWSLRGEIFLSVVEGNGRKTVLVKFIESANLLCSSGNPGQT